MALISLPSCIHCTIWDLNLIVFSEKGVSCSVLFTPRRTDYIVRDNAKKTSIGLSYKDVTLFSKIFYVFDVVSVK